MKKYTLQVNSIFSNRKARELREFLELKEKDQKRILLLVNKKLLKAIPFLTPLSIKDSEIKTAQHILLKLTDLVEKELGL